MIRYRLLIDYEVIEFIEKLRRRDQQLLRARFLAIQDFPGNFSDCVESDAVGRRIDVHICGPYAIKYWQDHADKHIKILDVQVADRSK